MTNGATVTANCGLTALPCAKDCIATPSSGWKSRTVRFLISGIFTRLLNGLCGLASRSQLSKCRTSPPLDAIAAVADSLCGPARHPPPAGWLWFRCNRLSNLNRAGPRLRPALRVSGCHRTPVSLPTFHFSPRVVTIATGSPMLLGICRRLSRYSSLRVHTNHVELRECAPALSTLSHKNDQSPARCSLRCAHETGVDQQNSILVRLSANVRVSASASRVSA